MQKELREKFRDYATSGRLYRFDETFIETQQEYIALVHKYNKTHPARHHAKQKILKTLFGAVGQNLNILAPLYANWGINTYWGDNCYASYSLTLVDDCEIHIGCNVILGPNVTLCAVGHPLDPTTRLDSVAFGFPIVIEDNVLIGANATILPGVTIGKNSVICAGSLITKSIPSNCVADGKPGIVVSHIK
ncbi:MAG: sugar O-acetyltransferase [Christensenellaceae bacterium]|jgi:galactoside O-acetyltransferase|nr:sugar O-acetyltransferase [Christensenellaceae bacterium]